MGVLLNRIKDWWQGADRTQKLVSVFGSLFLVALIGFTVIFASKPKMVPLYAGLDPADQGSVVEELRKNGVTVELGPNGAVLIPSDKEYEAKMMLATSNKLPNPGPKGMEGLDSLNLASTPAQEREKIKAAKEGDLARNIMVFQGVESAIVQINFGKDSPFAEETIEPSAVVSIKESAGSGVTPEAAKAIARLIQNSVAGLKAEKVSVINAAGRLIYDGEQQNSSDGYATKKLETERSEAKRREVDLQNRLDVAFGPGNTVAMVQVELNMDAVSLDKTERELGDKKVTGESTEQLTDGNSNTIGGAATTLGAPATNPGPAGKVNYTSSTKSMDYPSSETRTSTKKAGGELVSMTLSVIANSGKIKDPEPIQAILNDYLGAKNGQPGFKASVQAVDFDTTVQAEEKKAAASAASQSQMQQVLSTLPIGALLLVGFMVAKAIGRIPGRTLTMALPGGGAMSTALARTDDGMGGEAGAALKKTSVKTLASSDPELAEALEAMGIENIDESIDVEAIRRKIDLPLEQIKKMSRQNPQAVAMLLKGWLLEERR